MKPSISTAAALAGLFLGAVASSAYSAEGITNSLAEAVKNGKASLDLRYRYEWVDQDGFRDDADASLLRSRLTLESAPLHGFSALFEVDDVTSIGANDYNSTENGKTEYPVIADPEGTDVNQAWLKYTGQEVTATAGRQRINHDRQRFVGGVAWRQNEQTYDGGRIQWQPAKSWSLDVSYINQVNRIYGPDDGANPAELEGDNVFLRSEYRFNQDHMLSGFGYWLDFDDQGRYAAGKTVNNSSSTYGIEYVGKFDWLSVDAVWATQSDAGDSELDYDADYYYVELGAGLKGINFKLGYEVLASDNGVGFATPLATLHKFQGWADKFLATPGDGIEDAYASIGGSWQSVKLAVIYHDFQAESSSDEFGTELDIIATWPVNKQFTVQAKYASFETDNSERFADTDKAWLTLQLKL